MATIAEIRQKFPQYEDLSDAQLAEAVRRKFYSDMPAEEFNRRVGLSSPSPATPFDQRAAAAGWTGGSPTPIPPDMGYTPLERGVAREAGNAAQAADDMARIGSNALTFGFADKIAGGLSGAGTDAERAKTDAARDRAGLAATAMDIAGGATTGVGLAGRGITAMRAVPTALRGAKGVLARTGAMAVDGAAMGAANALGYDQPVGTGAAVGATAGALGNLVGEGVGAVGRAMTGKSGARVPTPDELKQLGNDAYEKATSYGIIVKPEAMSRLRSNVVNTLAEEGYTPEIQPKIASVLSVLERMSGGQNVTLKGLDNVRRVALNVAKSQDAAERRLAGLLIEQIDDFAGGLDKADILEGNADAAVKTLRQARDFWKRFRKSELIDTTLDKAERQAGRAYSGGNIDNATRQRIDGILNNPKLSRQFTATEREIMRQIVMGAPYQNIARLLGKLSPSGSGLMAILHAGGAAQFGPVGLIPPLVGMGAKGVSDRMTSASVDRLVEAVRLGKLPPQAINSLPGPAREAAVRALTALGINVAMPMMAPNQQ